MAGKRRTEEEIVAILRPAAMPMAKDAALVVTVARVAMPQGCCPALAKSIHAPYGLFWPQD